MNIDIYTEKGIAQPTKEHVIPNFLGGRLTSRKIIDRDTNSQLGGTIDAGLELALRSIILLVDGRSTRWPNEPAPSMQIESVSGTPYEVRAGGVVRPKPDLKVQVDGKSLRIEGSSPDLKEIRQAVRKKAEKQGLSLDSLMEQVQSRASERVDLMPMLRFPTELWKSEPYRATAKTACNLLAMHEGSLFLAPEFSPIRQFVLKGVRPTVWPVQAAPVDIRRPEANRIGPLDHLVVVRGDAASNRVTGLVTYFGALSFVVKLADCKLDQDFGFSYRVDQLGASDRQNAKPDLEIDIPDFEACARRSYEDYTKLACRQLESLLPDVMEIQERNWLRRLISPHWKRAVAIAANRELTTEEHQELVAAIVAAVVRELEPSIREASRQRHAAAEAEFQNSIGRSGDKSE